MRAIAKDALLVVVASDGTAPPVSEDKAYRQTVERIAWQYAARVGDAGESRAESAGVSRFLPGGSSLVGR